jgi:hypothetical protein
VLLLAEIGSFAEPRGDGAAAVVMVIPALRAVRDAPADERVVLLVRARVG